MNIIGILAGILLNMIDVYPVTGIMKSDFSSLFLIILLPPILF